MKDIKLDSRFKCFIYGLGLCPFWIIRLHENPLNLQGLVLKEKDQKFIWVFGCVLFFLLELFVLAILAAIYSFIAS